MSLVDLLLDSQSLAFFWSETLEELLAAAACPSHWRVRLSASEFYFFEVLEPESATWRLEFFCRPLAWQG